MPPLFRSRRKCSRSSLLSCRRRPRTGPETPLRAGARIRQTPQVRAPCRQRRRRREQAHRTQFRSNRRHDTGESADGRNRRPRTLLLPPPNWNPGAEEGWLGIRNLNFGGGKADLLRESDAIRIRCDFPLTVYFKNRQLNCRNGENVFPVSGL